MSTDDRPATNGTAWRLSSLESRVGRLESYEPGVLSERISTQAQELVHLTDELRSLRRALYSFALSIAGGAIIFGVTVLQVVK